MRKLARLSAAPEQISVCTEILLHIMYDLNFSELATSILSYGMYQRILVRLSLEALRGYQNLLGIQNGFGHVAVR